MATGIDPFIVPRIKNDFRGVEISPRNSSFNDVLFRKPYPIDLLMDAR
jgi:hypothetical protein